MVDFALDILAWGLILGLVSTSCPLFKLVYLLVPSMLLEFVLCQQVGDLVGADIFHIGQGFMAGGVLIFMGVEEAEDFLFQLRTI